MILFFPAGDGSISAEEFLNYLKVSGELEERSIYKRKERAIKQSGSRV